MKTFLATVAVVAATSLAMPAFAEGEIGNATKSSKSTGTMKESSKNNEKEPAVNTRASGSGSMGAQTTGSGDAKKDTAGSKDNPGEKTGVSGGNKQ